MFSPNVEEVRIHLRFWGFFWLEMIFVVLYFFDFVIVYRFLPQPFQNRIKSYIRDNIDF